MLRHGWLCIDARLLATAVPSVVDASPTIESDGDSIRLSATDITFETPEKTLTILTMDAAVTNAVAAVSAAQEYTDTQVGLVSAELTGVALDLDKVSAKGATMEGTVQGLLAKQKADADLIASLVKANKARNLAFRFTWAMFALGFGTPRTF